MNTKDIPAKVREIVARAMGTQHGPVPDDASLANDFGADELDMVEIAMDLEQAFDIEIPDGALERIDTVADLIAYVEKAKGETA